METRLYIVSDLHIGDSTKRDNYRKGTNLYRMFENSLIELEQEMYNDLCCGRSPYFVMLGDAVNGEYGIVDCYKSSAFQLVRSFIRKNPLRVLYVVGNHDAGAKDFANFLGLSTKNVAHSFWINEQIMLMHGHQFDPLCDGRTTLGLCGKFASWFVANFVESETEDEWRGEKPDGKLPSTLDIVSLHKGVDVELNASDKKIADCAAAYISEYVRKNYQDVLKIKRIGQMRPTIICGHTHQNKVRIEYEMCTYINAGKYSKDGILCYTSESDREVIRRAD